MTEFSKFIATGNGQKQNQNEITAQASNPLSSASTDSSLAINTYSQSLPRNTYDNDMAELLEIVRILNNMAPLKMPVYNFNLDEINGERYFRPDGTMILIREYDSDVIRDYYESKTEPNMVDRILEHDKITGRLRTKIEPKFKSGIFLKTNITIFDEKINRKYTIMQVTEDGLVNNISEFSGKGKSFQTLFRNMKTLKPARYLEGKDLPTGFQMLDCIFDTSGNIARIKKYNSKREVNIEYTDDKKNITVKNL